MKIITKILSKIIRFITPLRLLIVAIVLGFFWFFIFGNQGVYQLRKLALLKEKLITQKEELGQDIADLKDKKIFLENPQELEMVIREELGYVKPGEILIQQRKKND